MRHGSRVAVLAQFTECVRAEIKFAGTLPMDTAGELVDGNMADERALLRWPGAAAAVGFRIPVRKGRELATAEFATAHIGEAVSQPGN